MNWSKMLLDVAPLPSLILGGIVLVLAIGAVVVCVLLAILLIRFIVRKSKGKK